MASGTIGDSTDELNWRGGVRWSENSIVYTRRSRKKAKKTSNNNDSATPSASAAAGDSSTTQIPTVTEVESATVSTASPANIPAVYPSENPANHLHGSFEGSPHQELSLSRDKNGGSSPWPPLIAHGHVPSEFDDGYQSQNRVHKGDVDVESSPVHGEKDIPNGRNVGNEEHDEGLVSEVNANGVVKPGDGENGPVNANGIVKPLVISSFNDKIRFSLCKATPKEEIMQLRNNLEVELNHVRDIARQLASKELQLASNVSDSSNYVGTEGGDNVSGYNYPQPPNIRSNVVDKRLFVRVNSESRPLGLSRVNSDMGTARNLEPRAFNRQLSVAVMENNNRPNEFVEKEKRTPKANQYYRNSEFLLGKDRLPSESNKRFKSNNGRKHSGENEGFGFGFGKGRNQAFKNCSSLLQRLMKHKFGWVFNEPVNAKALGLIDYHDIIKHPMDLGTIKTKMSQNQYPSPREFSEDVRLVFHNAMTYNPKGQDVHFMAEQLLQIFEERWAVIEAEYNPYWKYNSYQDAGLSRKAPPPLHFSAQGNSPPFYAPTMQMPSSIALDNKIHRPHVGRTPAPKKPKAKDLNKRDMTYDEKQRLSSNLQGLPPEKLDAIVQIIKKRSTALSQNDDEIEVDIDNVDAETLWELDRFVTNYKKSLSKNKRKAELALQARASANQNATTNSNPPAEAQIESGTAFEKRTALADGEKRAFNGSRSSSSSSSSSDSGSSSSDSDSDSSSADGSDAAQSPKT